MRTFAIRGAITAAENTSDAILEATVELLKTLLADNKLDRTDLISLLFTVTPDLNQAFPAKAARDIGITDVALMCATEIPVAGALQKCVRVMMHVHCCNDFQPKHCYLRAARSLRPDLIREQTNE